MNKHQYYLSTTIQVDTSNNREIATAFGSKHNLENIRMIIILMYINGFLINILEKQII